MNIIIWTIQILLIPALSPLGIGVVKKLKAKLQNRKGASIFQPYKDLRKLFYKDETISKDASWISKFSPFIIFTVTLVVGASIPTVTSFLSNLPIGDILVVVYTLAIGTFFIALAGMDTGSSFGGFGSSREMTISALAEGGLIFSLLVVALNSGTSNLFNISSNSGFLLNYSFIPVIIAFLGFFVVLLAETARFPFDNPATHLELTMVHEAMILEYSGKRLALIEWASANKLLIFAALGVNLFFPWGIASSVSISAILFGLIIFITKVLIIYIAIAVLESSIAKFRFFRLPSLLMVSFILNIIAIFLLK